MTIRDHTQPNYHHKTIQTRLFTIFSIPATNSNDKNNWGPIVGALVAGTSFFLSFSIVFPHSVPLAVVSGDVVGANEGFDPGGFDIGFADGGLYDESAMALSVCSTAGKGIGTTHGPVIQPQNTCTIRGTMERASR